MPHLRIQVPGSVTSATADSAAKSSSLPFRANRFAVVIPLPLSNATLFLISPLVHIRYFYFTISKVSFLIKINNKYVYNRSNCCFAMGFCGLVYLQRSKVYKHGRNVRLLSVMKVKELLIMAKRLCTRSRLAHNVSGLPTNWSHRPLSGKIWMTRTLITLYLNT